MRQVLAAGAGLLIMTSGVFAQEAAVTPPNGYAFDQPQVLSAQLAWGRAHGVRLLVQACAHAGQGAAAEAGVDWLEREREEILAAGRDLARYYFGDPDVSSAAITHALGLRQELTLMPDALAAACDTLATALAGPRYDLARVRAQTLDSLKDAAVKAGPGPTQ
jgi:hypothetical protein